MKNRWAQGIEPRNFTWVFKDKFAISERPGGYSRNHRRVRRHEEILWLRQEGFDRIVSLLPSTHNLHAYDELGLTSSHLPFGASDDPRLILPQIFRALHKWLEDDEKILLHGEELGDTVMGVIAGYLLWTKRMPTSLSAIGVIEHLLQRQMGPRGRALVASHTAWPPA